MKRYTSIPQGVILSAVNKLEEYIKCTYGSAGKGILIDNGLYQSVVDDGFIAIEEFELEDELENTVVSYIKETTRATNKRAGDATTTSILVLCALIKGVYSNIEYAVNTDFIAIADSITKGLEVVTKKLRKISKKISTVEELEQIALNAYRNPKIARIVAEVVYKIGADGIVSIDDSDTFETSANVVIGMSIDKGYVSHQMSKNGENIELKNPAIVITDEDITKWSQIAHIVKTIGENGYSSMLFIADAISGDALNGLIINNVIGVCASGFAEERLEKLIDVAMIAKANVLSTKLGKPLSSFTISDCGSAKKVTVGVEETNIIDGLGTKEDIQKRADSIKPYLKVATHHDESKLKERIAKLLGGVAVIKIGAVTDTESRSIKMKIDDAVHATQLAYKEGRIVGGGLTLASIKSGSQWLDEALKYPRTILEENGRNYLTDVYDATGVVIIALESAVSVATSLITCGGIITNKKEDEK